MEIFDEKAEVVNHLFLVSTMIEEIGLVEVIDSIIPPNKRGILTTGDCVKIMVINALGITGKPMYLAQEFFTNKPIDQLIKQGITLDNINDDALGRSLDAIDAANSQLIFARVAAKAAKHFNINTTNVHLDTTSKVMFGAYDNKKPDRVDIVKHGYSKDKRPDCPQIMYSLLISNEGSFPLLGEIIAGNTSDKTHFREVLSIMKENLCINESDQISLIVDSAFYTEETVKEASSINIKFISRVPEQSNEAKKTLKWALDQEKTTIDENYSYCETSSNYAQVNQRWVVVKSESRYQSSKITVEKEVVREKEKFCSTLKALNKKEFSCKNDAQKALEKEVEKLKYHKATKQKISTDASTKKGKTKKKIEEKRFYLCIAEIEEDPAFIVEAIQKKSLFILATNQLDEEKLSSSDVLKKYKEQSKVEHSIKLLKNPLCMAPAVYLKNESRIRALGVIMLITLLIHTAIQHSIRKALDENNETLPNQLNKPTKTPTTKWIFTLFEDVVLLTITTKAGAIKKMLNLNNNLIKILSLLGPAYKRKYLLS